MAMFNTAFNSRRREVNYKVGNSLAHRESSSITLKNQCEAKRKVEDLREARALGLTLSQYRELVG